MSHIAAGALARKWNGRSETSGEMDAEGVRALQQQYRALLRADFESARSGEYPERLLLSAPLGRYARALPHLLVDLPRIGRRARRQQFRAVPEEASGYPAYYRRTFHWQSDGYLSDRSARLYDLSVEVLFLGCADVMRRRALAAVGRALAPSQGNGASAPHPKLVDVGCGTGRLLEMAAQAWPTAELRGLELSPHYAAAARKHLKGTASQVDLGNAEHLPYAEGSQDVVCSSFLLHEVPRAVRRTVVAEMLRVLRPGGTLVLLDAAQPSGAPQLEPALRRFPEVFHEPFFADYLGDDLQQLARGLGGEQVTTTGAFLSQVVTARKPA